MAAGSICAKWNGHRPTSGHLHFEAWALAYFKAQLQVCCKPLGTNTGMCLGTAMAGWQGACTDVVSGEVSHGDYTGGTIGLSVLASNLEQDFEDKEERKT